MGLGIGNRERNWVKMLVLCVSWWILDEMTLIGWWKTFATNWAWKKGKKRKFFLVSALYVSRWCIFHIILCYSNFNYKLKFENLTYCLFWFTSFLWYSHLNMNFWFIANVNFSFYLFYQFPYMLKPLDVMGLVNLKFVWLWVLNGSLLNEIGLVLWNMNWWTFRYRQKLMFWWLYTQSMKD